MQTGRRFTKKSDPGPHIEQALKNKGADIELLDILQKASQADVDAIKPFLPALLSHREWIVRAEALDFVGSFRMSEFLDLVKARLKDKNHVVRNYALTAYYDLLRAQALPMLEAASESRDIGYQVTALVLSYIETRNGRILNELKSILLRKRCSYAHRYAALNTFDSFVDVGEFPEVIELFELIYERLTDVPRAYGLDKDLPEYLRRWKRSQRKKSGAN
jgi:hypothetical protein